MYEIVGLLIICGLPVAGLAVMVIKALSIRPGYRRRQCVDVWLDEERRGQPSKTDVHPADDVLK